MKEVYQILAGALGQEMQMAQIANNLANVNTTGFKRDNAVFQDYFKASLKAQQGQGGPVGGDAASSAASNPTAVWPALGGPYVDFSVGTMQPTGQPLDMALEGDGFFQVQVAGESSPLYTRAGSFRVSDKQELVTADGRRVLDGGGNPIAIDLTRGRPEIASDGTITVKGSNVGQVGVVKFADPRKLEKYGEGLFRAPQGMAPQKLASPNLRQGMLEGSNVNAISEMTRMIQAERDYQTNAKAIQTLDELASKRIELARG